MVITANAHREWRPHPWHGLHAGPDAPQVVTAYIEITPFDVVKYEVDKETGYLSVDRPQLGASVPPTLYGFIPRTYCGQHVAALSQSTQQADGVLSVTWVEHVGAV
jgi:inorganic pyrophosphatase